MKTRWFVPLAMCLLLAFSIPASALDCTKATSSVEKAICGNEALLRADAQMSNSYKALLSNLAPDAARALRQSQRFWLKRRGWCEHAEAPISRCILRETISRNELLDGKPTSGPGTGNMLEPVFLVQQAAPDQYEVDVAVLRFPKPDNDGEGVFNVTVNDLLAKVPMGPSQDVAQTNLPFSYQLSMTVPLATPKFISAHVRFYEYSGGAHGNSSTRNININLQTGKASTFEDLFQDAARSILTQGCFAQIQEVKQTRFGDQGDGLFKPAERRRIVSDTISQLVNWSFDQTSATVVFDPYAIGSYAEGSYECRFKMNYLRALMKPASPLQPYG